MSARCLAPRCQVHLLYFDMSIMKRRRPVSDDMIGRGDNTTSAKSTPQSKEAVTNHRHIVNRDSESLSQRWSSCVSLMSKNLLRRRQELLAPSHHPMIR